MSLIAQLNTLATRIATEFKTVRTEIAASLHSEAPLTIPGTLVVSVGVIPFPVTRALTINRVYAAVGTAPSGSSVVFDVNKNGTTIFTTQGNRPTITTGNTVSAAAVPDVITLAAGDKITVDIDSIGGPAANAVVTLDLS